MSEQFAPDHIHTTPEGRHFRHRDGVEVDGDGEPIGTGFRVVFQASWEWWEIVSRGEIEIDEGCTGDWEQAGRAAEVNLDCEESWVARVVAVARRHEAIRVGDYVCCDGPGSNVFFVRPGQ